MLKINSFLLKKQGFNSTLANKENRVLPLTGMMALKNENGSAIIWVFLMIGIFAALNFAVSDGSRSGSAKISQEQARIAATEMLDYATAIKNAVQTLQINGCSNTEVSFDQAVVAGYANANSPTDESCHVFKLNGGGMNYQAPKKEWLDSSKSAESHYGIWFTSSAGWITGLGIDGSGANCLGGGADGSCRELMTGTPYIKQEICLAINKKLGWGTDDNGTPYKDNGNSYGAGTHGNFIGAYSSGSAMGSSTPSDYSNIMAGCIEGDTDPAAGSYSFFQVLIVR